MRITMSITIAKVLVTVTIYVMSASGTTRFLEHR